MTDTRQKSVWFDLGVRYGRTKWVYRASRDSELSIWEAYIAVLTVEVTVEVVDQLIKNTEEVMDSIRTPEHYYRRNWWHITKSTPPQRIHPPERLPVKVGAWPPFTGVRVELGGDTK